MVGYLYIMGLINALKMEHNINIYNSLHCDQKKENTFQLLIAESSKDKGKVERRIGHESPEGE